MLSAPTVFPLPRPGGSEWRRDVVARGVAVSAFAGFVGYYGLLCFRHTWAADFQMYVAGVSRLYTSFQEPGHEVLALPSTYSSLYTPYLFAVAFLGKITGITPYAALQGAGVFNVALYALGSLYLFSRHSLHFRSYLPAACFLLITLFLRGEHFGWSSETSLVTFQFVQAYPSTFAWGMAFFALGLMEDLRVRPSFLGFGLLTFALWLLVTCHVITGSWVCGIVGLYGLRCAFEYRDWRQLHITTPVVAALALAFAVSHTRPSAHAASAIVHEPSILGARPLWDLANLYFVALPCALWFVLRLKRHAFWVCGFGVTFGALALWRSLSISFGNRYSLFMGFFAQFIVAEAVAFGILVLTRGRPSTRTQLALGRDDRTLTMTLLVAAVIACACSPMLAVASSRSSVSALLTPCELFHQPSPSDQYYRKYRTLAAFLSEKDIVVTPHSREVFDIAATTGARFASAPGAIRVPDVHERARAVTTYFDPLANTVSRRALLVRYGATKVLLPRSHHVLFGRLRSELGEPLFEDHRFALFVVPR